MVFNISAVENTSTQNTSGENQNNIKYNFGYTTRYNMEYLSMHKRVRYSYKLIYICVA